MVNLIATIPGQRTDRIVLASHFDTKLFREFRFVGASDGASSTAALLDLARVLKARPQLPFTIELLFLDGEEATGEWKDPDNTYGSRHYVEVARKAGTLKSLRALILLDMIGDRQLNIRRETQSTPWLNDIVWNVAKRLGHQGSFIAEEMPVEDDHVHFLKAGVPAIDIIDLDYPHWHTAQDTLENVSARSLQVVGDVVVAALLEIEARLLKLNGHKDTDTKRQILEIQVLLTRSPSFRGFSVSLSLCGLDLSGTLPAGSPPQSAPSSTPSPSRRHGPPPGRWPGCRAAPARTTRSTSLTSARLRSPGGGRRGSPESTNRPRPSARCRPCATP